MNDKHLKSISSKISRQFPEVSKSKPKVPVRNPDHPLLPI